MLIRGGSYSLNCNYSVYQNMHQALFCFVTAWTMRLPYRYVSRSNLDVYESNRPKRNHRTKPYNARKFWDSLLVSANNNTIRQASATKMPRVTDIYTTNHPSSILSKLKLNYVVSYIGFLPDTLNCGLRIRWESRERFPRYRRQRKLLYSDSGMHHGTCVTHMPWCMSQLAILNIWQEAHWPVP